eukprot:GILJ01001317.1.p1 GENE.GILJ01001317.1~~GILJ01001317.1.p1  ORF type:complete len:612 (-),score=57.30 GILJ01001317.1:453-2288(-)
MLKCGLLLVLASVYVAFGFPISCADVEITDSVILTEPKEGRWPQISELDSMLPENVFVSKTVDWSTISTEGVRKTHKQVVNVNGHHFTFENSFVRVWVEASKKHVLLVSSRFAKASGEGSLSEVFGKQLKGKEIISVEDAKQAIEKADSGVHLHFPKKVLRYARTSDDSCEFQLLYSVYGTRADGAMVQFELSATEPANLRVRNLRNKRRATLLRSSSEVSTSHQAAAKMSNVILNWPRPPYAYTLTTDGSAITDRTTPAWHLLTYRHAGRTQVRTTLQGHHIAIRDGQDPMMEGNCTTGRLFADDCPSPEAAIITHYNAVKAYHFFRDEYGWVLRDHFVYTPVMLVDIDSPEGSSLTHTKFTDGHGASITVGTGAAGQTYGGGVDAGLVGHEFAHAVWMAEHGFAEPQDLGVGALAGVEEAFCDIMGLRVKARANQVGDVWGIHADRYRPAPHVFNPLECPDAEEVDGDDNKMVGCINRDRDFSLSCHADEAPVAYPRPYEYFVCPNGVSMYEALDANQDPHVQGLIIGHWYYRMRHAHNLLDNLADRMLIPFSLTTGATAAPYLEFAQWTLHWLRVRTAYYGDEDFCLEARNEWLGLGFPDGDLPQCSA